MTNVTVQPCLNIDLSKLANRCNCHQWHHLSDIAIPNVNADQVHLLKYQLSKCLISKFTRSKAHHPKAMHKS